MRTSKNTILEQGIKGLLTLAAPFQKFIDKPGYTHEFCNSQALIILANDGYAEYAAFYNKYLSELNKGVYWADSDWKNINHYFNPATGKGLWHCTNAVETMQGYYHQALQLLYQHEIKKSIFFLGAALHLLQDLCEPHHARGKLLSGHKGFEQWAQLNCAKFKINSGVLCNNTSSLAAFAIKNSKVGADFLSWVSNGEDQSKYEVVAKELLPLAQRSTAGLLI
ncbi:MAG TPA: zinc dependent phospholipase C family protein, partial [Candidatus Avacidaminococcus intestinavium]|nr:zinc dependent phospholipase C family protein [Candidatus Avacidaminococcus intestinavium]